MIKFRNILWIGLFAVPLFALGDVMFIAKPLNSGVTFWHYLFICVFEYSLFWTGYWAGDIKKKELNTKFTMKDYAGFIIAGLLIGVGVLVVILANGGLK